MSESSCYLSTGHDGHDLLEPGQKCKACDFVADYPTCRMCGTPVSQQDAEPPTSPAYRWAGPCHKACAAEAVAEYESWLRNVEAE